MDALLEILFGTPFGMIGLIAFVSWVLNMIKNAQQATGKTAVPRPERRQAPMPSFGGDLLDERDVFDAERPTANMDRRAASRPLDPGRSDTTAAGDSRPAAASVSAELQPIRRPAPVRVESPASVADPDAALPALSADAARQGMMWAEVFGPPRAKRPFRTAGRN